MQARSLRLKGASFIPLEEEFVVSFLWFASFDHFLLEGDLGSWDIIFKNNLHSFYLKIMFIAVGQKIIGFIEKCKLC